jgi:superfamily II DNA/RNA helicase
MGEKTPGKTLVFCNTMESVDAVSQHLTAGRVMHAVLHGRQDAATRQKSLAAFVACPSRAAKIQKAAVSAAASDVLVLQPPFHPRILVATDLASRGLDLPAVSRVILFDFPQKVFRRAHSFVSSTSQSNGIQASTYLHRAGRTGRAQRAGTVHTLVGHIFCVKKRYRNVDMAAVQIRTRDAERARKLEEELNAREGITGLSRRVSQVITKK